MRYTNNNDNDYRYYITKEVTHMRTQKYSRQREAVYTALCSVRTHPVAAEVYDMVRAEIPDISLSTVYRNLSQLAEAGKALTITDEKGVVHFDGFVHPHNHLFCRLCRKVVDVDIPVAISVPEGCDHSVEGYSVLFTGTCNGCRP